jgi:DMSO reductase family type II enzyme chaperone
MQPIATVTSENKSEQSISQRTKLYAIIAEMFRYPDATFRRQAKNGHVFQALKTVADSLPYAFDLNSHDREDLQSLSLAADEEIEVEYIRLFDAGPGSPPVPLIEGGYRNDRKAIIKEHILFYNHFGLSYAEGSMEDRPDHITYQMEFLHFLSFKELMAAKNGKDRWPYLRAQHDFVSRHPLMWIPAAIQKLDDIWQDPPDAQEAALDVFRFYRALFRTTHRYLTADLNYLRGLMEH